MTRLTIALAVLTAVFAFPSAAHADRDFTKGPGSTTGDPYADTQHCVSQREWHGLYQQIKPKLEERWEVEGLGIEAYLEFGLVHDIVVYPRCGYTLDVAWYGITYKRRGKHLWAVYATQCATWLISIEVEGEPTVHPPCWDYSTGGTGLRVSERPQVTARYDPATPETVRPSR